MAKRVSNLEAEEGGQARRTHIVGTHCVGIGVGRSADRAYAQADCVEPVLVGYKDDPHEQIVSVVP